MDDGVPHGQAISVVGVVESNMNMLSAMIQEGCEDIQNITNRETSCCFIFGGKRHIWIL